MRTQLLKLFVVSGVVMMSLADAPIGAAAADAGAELNCKALENLSVPNTTIRTESVAAGSFRTSAPMFGPPPDFSRLPAFCRVTGTIRPTDDSDIRFELWLPLHAWNGRFLQTGNGGSAGRIIYESMAEPLMRGYAVANTDTGHRAGEDQFSWTAGHPERVTDYAYRAIHVLTVNGKTITQAAYGRSPSKSFWLGCSTGGRQGLKEAQRFPDDYDAIVAGAPANNWAPLMALGLLIQRELTGESGLTVDRLRVLTEGALAQCDTTDGLRDRIIGEPAKCTFDPRKLVCSEKSGSQCLSPAAVAAAARLYRGVIAESGRTVFPGTGPGSELQWAAYALPQFGIGTDYYRDVIAKNANWNPASFDVDVDIARAEELDHGDIDATDPDLGKFMAHGGKLILYHGTADGLIPFANTINYYHSVVAKVSASAAQKGLRFYLVPGMQHCTGGEGAFEVDWLGALEKWVADAGTASELRGEHPAKVFSAFVPSPPPGRPFSRPVCAYPLLSRYKGRGDVADASNFSCISPATRGSHQNP
jgi:feruloyl esterase